MKIDPYHACDTSTHLNRQWRIQRQGQICSAGRPWAIESLPAPFHKEEILSVSCECRSHSVTGKSCSRESNRNVLGERTDIVFIKWSSIWLTILGLPTLCKSWKQQFFNLTTGWWTEVLLNFNFTDICLSGNHSSCNVMFFNAPQWMTPFCPCVQQQNLQEKLNNLASEKRSSLMRSFSNVAIVTMFLQQQKSKLKNIWNIFPNLSQKSNFRAGCLKLSSAALSVLYYYVCCSPFSTSCGRQRASHTSLVWFRELEAVTNLTWQIFFCCS